MFKEGFLSNWKKSKRFYKYFFSYIFILAVALVILGAVVYGGFISTLKHEVQLANIASLRQLQDTMDMHLREMNRTIVNINSNDLLKPYKMQLGGYDLAEAVGELQKYKSGNDFVYDIALYHVYRSNHRICSTVTDTDLDTFFEYEYKYENWDKDDFLSMVETLDSPMIRSLETVRASWNKVMGLTTFVHPVKMSDKPYSIVMFFVQEDVLKNSIRNILSDYNGYIYILDEHDKPVVYLSEGEDESNVYRVLDAVKEISDTDNNTEINALGKKYSVAKVKSENYGWSFITVIPTRQFMSKVYTKQNLFNYALSMVLFVGVIVAFVLATRSYKPIMNLTKAVATQGAMPAGDDEFVFINRIFNQVSNEKMSLMVKLKGNAAILRQQLLLDILKGKNNEKLKEWINSNDEAILNLNYPFFTVLLIQIDNTESYQGNDDSVMRDLIKYSIVNVIEELAQEVGWGYGVELVDNRRVALILNMKSENAKERYISELAFRAKEFFKDHFVITLTIGVGRIYESLLMVHESYEEASKAIYYRLLKGYDSVIFYEDIKDTQKEKYRYPSELEAKLLNAIKQGNILEVENMSEELRDYIKSNVVTPEAAQCIGFGIINAVIKGINEVGIVPEECYNDNDAMLFTSNFETVDDLGHRLTEFCKSICTYIENHKVSKNQELFEKINKIINERVMDSSLCLESIASECGVSPSYVSRFFKIQTGNPLMQYIDSLRTNEVKRMLRETDVPLKDILEQVGYIDQSNFIRKFKIKEGITPIQYRNISQSNLQGEPIKN